MNVLRNRLVDTFIEKSGTGETSIQPRGSLDENGVEISDDTPGARRPRNICTAGFGPMKGGPPISVFLLNYFQETIDEGVEYIDPAFLILHSADRLCL
jgi:hypothetical protein